MTTNIQQGTLDVLKEKMRHMKGMRGNIKTNMRNSIKDSWLKSCTGKKLRVKLLF
jgi:hypothetical protein